MEKIVLIFPDTSSLASFIVHHEIKNAQVNSEEQSLTAALSGELIAIATADYRATPLHRLHKAEH